MVYRKSPVRLGDLSLTILSPDREKLEALAPKWKRECEKAGITGDKLGKDFHVLELPRRKGPFDALQEMFEMRAGLGITEVALREMPELRRALWNLQTLRCVGRDRICVIQPELAGFAHAADH